MIKEALNEQRHQIQSWLDNNIIYVERMGINSTKGVNDFIKKSYINEVWNGSFDCIFMHFRDVIFPRLDLRAHLKSVSGHVGLFSSLCVNNSMEKGRHRR